VLAAAATTSRVALVRESMCACTAPCLVCTALEYSVIQCFAEAVVVAWLGSACIRMYEWYVYAQYVHTYLQHVLVQTDRRESFKVCYFYSYSGVWQPRAAGNRELPRLMHWKLRPAR
jgi:hypothetical protein